MPFADPEPSAGSPRADRLDAVLRALLREEPGLEAAAVVSPDGLPMASALPVGLDEDRVAAMSAALLALGDRAAAGLGRGDLTQVCVEGDDGSVVLVAAGPDAVLVAVAGRQARTGLVVWEVRHAAARVAEVLGAGTDDLPEPPHALPPQAAPAAVVAPRVPAPAEPAAAAQHDVEPALVGTVTWGGAEVFGARPVQPGAPVTATPEPHAWSPAAPVSPERTAWTAPEEAAPVAVAAPATSWSAAEAPAPVASPVEPVSWPLAELPVPAPVPAQPTSWSAAEAPAPVAAPAQPTSWSATEAPAPVTVPLEPTPWTATTPEATSWSASEALSALALPVEPVSPPAPSAEATPAWHPAGASTGHTHLATTTEAADTSATDTAAPAYDQAQDTGWTQEWDAPTTWVPAIPEPAPAPAVEAVWTAYEADWSALPPAPDPTVLPRNP